MDQNFHNLIMVNHSLLQKRVLNALAQDGLTPGQPKVLDYLSNHDGSIQKDIAHGCQIDPATLTGILERMEDKGLVKREAKEGNRRSSYVYLTESGRVKSEKVKQVFLEQESELFQGIGQEEQTQLIRTLYKIFCNMTEPEVNQ
ncbi:MarR family transcriptional regulator [Anoxybacterium hadale]|uniref:MarR family transcriptional regulator n=1 Tax=Anoxybacterium hadale TaxID=3408580 RepID=A0ACD1AE27_9FIRM|nr:MarR family transcriptional regulator [Clostridiales bacterium]